VATPASIRVAPPVAVAVLAASPPQPVINTHSVAASANGVLRKSMCIVCLLIVNFDGCRVCTQVLTACARRVNGARRLPGKESRA
jgi:hypothetical protein